MMGGSEIGRRSTHTVERSKCDHLVFGVDGTASMIEPANLEVDQGNRSEKCGQSACGVDRIVSSKEEHVLKSGKSTLSGTHHSMSSDCLTKETPADENEVKELDNFNEY
jgi:hypothetical protein